MLKTPPTPDNADLAQSLERYRRGESRTVIFRDLVLSAVRLHTQQGSVVLDIGCGHGFHGDLELQRSITAASRRAIGIEPDAQITPPTFFSEIHRCTFEQAPIPAESVHVAYASFVLEHISEPAAFWEKLYDCLAPQGVFWGFTVDSRHWFSAASRLTEVSRLKNVYMTWLRGRRASDRYENYPTLYRANSPRAIRQYTARFRRTEFASMHRVGQVDYYIPRPMRWLSHALEWSWMRARLPGSILVVKLTK